MSRRKKRNMLVYSENIFKNFSVISVPVCCFGRMGTRGTKVGVEAMYRFEAFHVRIDNFVTEEVEIEIILWAIVQNLERKHQINPDVHPRILNRRKQLSERKKKGNKKTIFTERLLDLFTCCQKTEIDEGGRSNTWDCVPSKLIDKLERQEKEV